MNSAADAVSSPFGRAQFIWSAAAVIGLGSFFSTRPAEASYEVVTVTNGGSIDGYITLSGNTPSAGAVKITKNQDYCGTSIADPTYIVGSNGGLSNVVVYLKDIKKGKAPSADALSLVSEDCMMRPRVQGAMTGGRITMSSNDAILHNVHSLKADTNATIYNVALPFAGVSVTKSLPDSPGLIKVKCDAQEWMQAWILQLEHPYYATTGADGHFVIKDIPPGNYTLVAWHEAAGEASASIDVTPGHKVEPTMTFTAGRKAESTMTLAAR
ncbi:MAG: hypothetical protein QOK23_3218 [Gammaproteobacteria bacterium]|jgi:hypothetical protein|nr:hypothetical protein [Gammaproteobacteria bacterium]